MQKTIKILIIVIMYFTIISVLYTNPQSIIYTESSGGLQSIMLDGGRTELEIVDINNDGQKDILSIGDHGSPFINTQQHGVMIWFGNGTGSNWSLHQNGNFGYGGIAIGDVNNDSKLDIGYGMHHDYSTTDFGDQILEVALGDGTGMNWTAWDDSLATQGEDYGMFTTDFGDIDNDGFLDIGSVSFGCCAGIHVYKNMTDGKWRQTFGFTGGNCLMEFSFGDINNDGNLDFGASHQFGSAYFGDGLGGFVPYHNNLPPLGNSGLRGISLGDVNNDGAKDISFVGSGGSIQVWKWNNGSLLWDDLSSNLPATSTFSKTILNDMNMDGYVDLVAYGSSSLAVFTGNGGTSWALNASFASHLAPGTYSGIAVGDVDNNGYPDIAIEAAEDCGTFCDRNIVRLFKETTPYSSLSITPLYPRGFEKVKNNSVRFIEWISASQSGDTSKIKLEFSSNGNNGPWISIADSLPNNGRHQWQVPSLVSSNNCFIRFTVYTPGSSFSSINSDPFIIGNLVGINQSNEIATDFSLSQNYPNPFNPVTIINYSIPFPQSGIKGQTSKVKLAIYNSLGEEVLKLVNENQNAGNYSIEWDASNYSGGIYFYKLTAGDFAFTRKMILLK